MPTTRRAAGIRQPQAGHALQIGQAPRLLAHETLLSSVHLPLVSMCGFLSLADAWAHSTRSLLVGYCNGKDAAVRHGD